MKRDLGRLADETFDLAVIGGGVYGLAAARDAARRGLRVAVLEQEDFGCGNSGNSQKIVHGGLRYLQHADLRRMRESIRERRALLATAPHLVRPLAFLMPTRGRGARSRLAMRVALATNDLIGLDRNSATADAARRLPGGRILSLREAESLAPGALPPGSTGAALWYDAQMIDSERLLLALARAAHEAGAALANHAPVEALHLADGRVAGVQVRDGESGGALTVHARVTLCTAAASGARLLARAVGHAGQPPPLSLGMNLVLGRSLFGDVAVGISSRQEARDPDARIHRGERLFFATPWEGTTIVGTLHLPLAGDPAAFRLTRRHLTVFLEELAAARPRLAIDEKDIGLIHHGLLPAVPGAGDGRHAVLQKHYSLVDHGEAHGLPGLLSVTGVKWTTARDVAERAVDRVLAELGGTAPPCTTATTPLPGGDIEQLSDFLAAATRRAAEHGCAEAVARRLARRYGTLWPEVLATDPRAATPLAPGSPVVRGEVLYALRAEMALSLADLVRRRTGLGSAAPPERQALLAAAQLAAGVCGWSAERTRREIEAVEALYRLPA